MMAWSHHLIILIVAVYREGSAADNTEFRVTTKDTSGTVRALFYHGGSVNLSCSTPIKVNKIEIFKIGEKETPPVVSTTTTTDKLQYKIYLNDTQKLGRYKCDPSFGEQVDRDIGYTLCNPLEIKPPVICSGRELCVINGSTPSCQSKIECGDQGIPLRACRSAVDNDAYKGLCGLYSRPGKLPSTYYLGTPASCETVVRFYNHNKKLDFGATTAITSMMDLNLVGIHQSKYLACNFLCEARAPNGQAATFTSPAVRKTIRANITFQSGIKTPTKLPAKATMKCSSVYESDDQGTMYFYLLFYVFNKCS